MTRAAALDCAKENVRVNAVEPGPVEMPLLGKLRAANPHGNGSSSKNTKNTSLSKNSSGFTAE